MADTTYDLSGNQIGVNGNSVAYDAENHQITVTEPASLGGAAENYLYDGLGQRVEKAGPGGALLNIYDAFGQLAAEYSNTYSSSSFPWAKLYLSYDQLGSVRMVTDPNGAVVARHDFLPYGEEIPAGVGGRSSLFGTADNVSQRFTGQIRDSETGEDYFNARMFGTALGRFTSPDPGTAGADPSNPQNWNAYSYVVNNPLILVDPTGQSFLSIFKDSWVQFRL